MLIFFIPISRRVIFLALWHPGFILTISIVTSDSKTLMLCFYDQKKLQENIIYHYKPATTLIKVWDVAHLSVQPILWQWHLKMKPWIVTASLLRLFLYLPSFIVSILSPCLQAFGNYGALLWNASTQPWPLQDRWGGKQMWAAFSRGFAPLQKSKKPSL